MKVILLKMHIPLTRKKCPDPPPRRQIPIDAWEEGLVPGVLGWCKLSLAIGVYVLVFFPFFNKELTVWI